MCKKQVVLSISDHWNTGRNRFTRYLAQAEGFRQSQHHVVTHQSPKDTKTALGFSKRLSHHDFGNIFAPTRQQATNHGHPAIKPLNHWCLHINTVFPGTGSLMTVARHPIFCNGNGHISIFQLKRPCEVCSPLVALLFKDNFSHSNNALSRHHAKT